MSRSLALIAAALLSACASTADVPIASPAFDGVSLGQQQLQDGECGLFGWDVSGSPRFVFFATPSRGVAVMGATIIDLPPSNALPAPDGKYGPLTLDLGRAEALDEGRRYPYARMKYRQDDGFTRTVPMVAIESCQAVESPL